MSPYLASINARFMSEMLAAQLAGERSRQRRPGETEHEHYHRTVIVPRPFVVGAPND